MTHAQFVKLAKDFYKYASKQVSYQYFSPAANRIVKSSGILLGIGIDSPQCNTVIVGDKGHRSQMFYAYVDFPKE